LESISTANWAIGFSGYYGKGYIPPAAIAMSQKEIAKIPIRNIEDVFEEMENSNRDALPDHVKERLEFM